jgi:agmatinase
VVKSTPPHFDPDAAAAEGSGIFGLPFSAEQSRIIVLPVPFEATTSYGGGAARAPRAVLRASRQVDLYDRETGRPYEAGIAMLPVSRRVETWNREAKRLAAGVIRAGGRVAGNARLTRALARVNEIGALLNEWVRAQTERCLEQGKVVVVLGGDHAVPFGAMESYARRHREMGILHIDAHCDLREAFEGFTWSHASIFHNVVTRLQNVSRLVQVGVRDMGTREDEMIRASRGRIVLHHDAELARRLADGATWSSLIQNIVASLPETVYISFDIDGLDPALCPHTGTPVPGGLSFHQATSLMLEVARSGRTIVGADLCEVSPGPGGGEWDANVGTRILYKMIGSIVLSQSKEMRRAHSSRTRGTTPTPS